MSTRYDDRRFFQYGYRVTEVPLAPLGPSRDGSCVIMRGLDVDLLPRPVAVTLPIYLDGIAQPRPDMKHAVSIAAGARKRVVCRLPELDLKLVDRFKRFVRSWIHQNLAPLAADTDVSAESWLEEAPYPQWRKEELWAVDVEHKDGKLPRPFVVCKSFIKDESYPEWKFPRTINPRPDTFKKLTGPIFHRIEQQIFQLHWFIKKVPLVDRPAYIEEFVARLGAEYFATDYSSFEASFSKEIMEACEMQLYEYMSQNVSGGAEWYQMVHEALTGPQELRFRNVVVKTQATRMSGDMCTSLGNGFTNLMLMLFAGHELGLGELRAVFEGDDGLGCFERGLPHPEFFNGLGFNVKMEKHKVLSEASFCGMIYDPEDLVNITDPCDVLSKLGWAKASYRGASHKKLMALLRMKALSLAHQYHGAPIIYPAARRILELTRGYNVKGVIDSRNMSFWEYQKYSSLKNQEPEVRTVPIQTRRLMERKYGISVEKQLEVEKQISTLELGAWKLNLDCPAVWSDCWDMYVDHGSKTYEREPMISASFGEKPLSYQIFDGPSRS